MDFTDKRILITGSSRGVGKAAAKLFLGHGARVAINGRTEESVAKAITELGGDNLVAAPGDVASKAGCDAVVGQALDGLRGLGGLDVLVNSAGVYRTGDIEGFDEAEWDRTMAVNLKGPFFCTMAALAALRESKGNVVHVASESGLIGNPASTVYCASKGGVVNMTRAMALDLAPEVRVNCICPGGIDTDMTQRDLAQYDDPKALYAAMCEGYPLKRIATPEEVAGGIVYLASAGAGFMTGAALAMDGGSSAGH